MILSTNRPKCDWLCLSYGFRQSRFSLFADFVGASGPRTTRAPLQLQVWSQHLPLFFIACQGNMYTRWLVRSGLCHAVLLWRPVLLKAGTHYRIIRTIFAPISPLRSKPAKARLSDVCKGHGVWLSCGVGCVESDFVRSDLLRRRDRWEIVNNEHA